MDSMDIEDHSQRKRKNRDNDELTQASRKKAKRQYQQEIKTKKKTFERGPQADLEAIPNKKVRSQVYHKEALIKKAVDKAARNELLLEGTAGFLEPETPLEKTWQVTQDQIKDSVCALAANKLFSLDLKDFGPYKCEYSQTGMHLLLAGEKGHVALLDWNKSDLMTELHLKEQVHDITFLHNETMFATAQKQNVYVYDKQGVEIHVLKQKHPAYCLQYLPYHFLLASGGRGGYVQWQDISTGKIAASHATKKGNIFTMKQNPANAVIHVGHTAGMVSLWTPNMSEPVVSMLCHKGAVNGLAIQQSGNLMVTTGLDGFLKVWDIRKFEEVGSYLLPSKHNIRTLDISQRGVLAIGFGAHAELWKDWQTSGGADGNPKRMEPYMIHRAKPGQFIHSLRFCPYEDILGIGHTSGFLSFGAPGVGEPNFDSFTADVFQTKARRREATVYNLLHKIPADMIVLDPTQIGTVTQGNPQEHLQFQQEALKDSFSPRFEKEKKEVNRMRGKNKIGRKLARKEKENMAEKRELQKAALVQQEKERSKRAAEDEDDDQPHDPVKGPPG